MAGQARSSRSQPTCANHQSVGYEPAVGYSASWVWKDTEIIARKIIELRQRGVREPEQLVELTIKELGVE